HRHAPSFPTRRSSDLRDQQVVTPREALHPHNIAGTKILDASGVEGHHRPYRVAILFSNAEIADDRGCVNAGWRWNAGLTPIGCRSEEHTSELQSLAYL